MLLGLWLEVRPADDVARVMDRVAALGFGSVQAHFPQLCDATLARRVARACGTSGLDLVAVSGYANPLRPELAPMGYTVDQLAGLVALMPTLRARRLVSWDGTYGAGVGEGHADNASAAALDTLRRHVDELLPALEAVEGALVLEPFFSHVLGTPERAAALCREFGSPHLRVVLDAPNLLPPERWGQQAELIRAMVAELAPFVGLVHLKDMRLRDGKLDMPGPGQGILDYRALLGAIARLELTAPLIVEHVTLDQAAEARRYVLAQARSVT